MGVTSYRRIPTRSVRGGVSSSSGNRPSWLDGKVQVRPMDEGTAQVTPLELTNKLMNAAIAKGAKLEIGTVEVCIGSGANGWRGPSRMDGTS